METVILTIHMLLALSLVGIILLQRSEGSGLNSNSTMGGLMTSRASGNLLTRTTAILAACFMATSLILAFLGGGHHRGTSSLEKMIEQSAPASSPATETPVAPAATPTPTDSDRPAP